MFIRLFMSLFLITSFAITTLGHAHTRQEETPTQAKEESLTPDEEREARVFVEDFMKRLEKSEDVAPLVNEFFVSDFADRARGRMDSIFPLATTAEVAEQLSNEEILRAYAASFNCIFVVTLHYTDILRRRANERAKRGEPKNPEADRVLSIEELIPPKLISLIESDPTLAAILSHELKEENRKREKESADVEPAPVLEADRYKDSEEAPSLESLVPFKTVEQLRHYTLLLEQGVALLREQINSFPNDERPPLSVSWRKLINASSSDDVDQNQDRIKPNVDILDGEFMGYPKGTRLICASVLMFDVAMVRGTDGQLRIVHMYIQGN